MSRIHQIMPATPGWVAVYEDRPDDPDQVIGWALCSFEGEEGFDQFIGAVVPGGAFAFAGCIADDNVSFSHVEFRPGSIRPASGVHQNPPNLDFKDVSDPGSARPGCLRLTEQGMRAAEASIVRIQREWISK